VLSSGETVDGSAAAWTAMFAAAEAGLATDAAYTNFITTHLDVDNFIDWMMLNLAPTTRTGSAARRITTRRNHASPAADGASSRGTQNTS
jgi:hypothetical protein